VVRRAAAGAVIKAGAQSGKQPPNLRFSFVLPAERAV
jgi:hypothetical protein